MYEKFSSPQTESEYKIVNSDPDVQVSFRKIEKKFCSNLYRVRIQCKDSEILESIVGYMSSENIKKWGKVKEEDHVSVVVAGEAYLAFAVADATKAVTYYQVATMDMAS
jgi:hypothetical protein